VPQLLNAVGKQNDGTPGGVVLFGREQMATRNYGRYTSAESMRDMPVASSDQGTVLLSYIADVEDSHKPVYARTFVDGTEGVGLSVALAAGANQVSTDDALLGGLKTVDQVLPKNTSLVEISDLTTTTRDSIEGVQHSLIEAIILVALVILVFLHSPRSTGIVLVAIPTALITTYAGMLMFGFTLNVITNMALVLVIGVLVDDSIVVIENITRHLGLGEKPMDAALNGRTEIGMAAMAITMVDVVVYTPIAFMSGTIGQIFKEFGLTVVVSVLLSLFVSFTLTPMLSSRFLKAEHEGGSGPWGRFTRAFDSGFAWLEKRYERILDWALAHRWLPPLVAAVLLVCAISLIPLGVIHNEYLPQIDNGVISVLVELPPGSSLVATDQTLRAIEAQLRQLPEVAHYMSTSGVQQPGMSQDWSTDATARFGNVNVGLVPVKQRHRNVEEVMADLRHRVQAIPDAKITMMVASTTGSAQMPVQVRIRGIDDAETENLANQVLAIVQQTPGAIDVDTDWKPGNPEARFVPNRLLSSQMGILAQQAGQVVQAMTQGIVASKLREPGQREADIRVVGSGTYDPELSALKAVPMVGSQNGQPVTVSLDQVATIEAGTGPAALKRYNRARTITITANVADGYVLNEVTDPIGKAIDSQIRNTGQIPPGYYVEFGGDVENQAKNFGQVEIALGLSIVLVYMLLAALYESLILPFTVLFALPVALVGALGGLAITHNTLNLISLIGLIVLMALVGKNGILLVDYTNTLRAEGLTRHDALLKAGPTRMRPIMMTSSAMIMGMMPLALGLEPGSELYTAMATEIIGGMATSTLLSLIVVPCMYTYFDDLQHLLGRWVTWRPRRRPPTDRQQPTDRPKLELAVPPAGAAE
jgi:HAE1 family hydrophobic/amphiphilic exporter-1